MVENEAIIHQLPQENRSNEQFFFTEETTRNLSGLCVGTTACLFTPTLALETVRQGKKNVVAFDLDRRFETQLGSAFQYYDANSGLLYRGDKDKGTLVPLYQYKFDTVVADPPYSAVSPDQVARNVHALLKWDLQGESYAYVAHLRNCFPKLESAFEKYCMVGQPVPDFKINYKDTPRNVLEKGVMLYQFRRV